MFGVKNGDVVLEDYHRVIMNGLKMYGVVGRRIFETWDITKRLLEDESNGIQKAVYDVILNGGQDTVSDIRNWDKMDFEGMISRHPKALIRFAG